VLRIIAALVFNVVNITKSDAHNDGRKWNVRPRREQSRERRLRGTCRRSTKDNYKRSGSSRVGRQSITPHDNKNGEVCPFGVLRIRTVLRRAGHGQTKRIDDGKNRKFFDTGHGYGSGFGHHVSGHERKVLSKTIVEELARPYPRSRWRNTSRTKSPSTCLITSSTSRTPSRNRCRTRSESPWKSKSRYSTTNTPKPDTEVTDQPCRACIFCKTPNANNSNWPVYEHA